MTDLDKQLALLEPNEMIEVTVLQNQLLIRLRRHTDETGLLIAEHIVNKQTLKMKNIPWLANALRYLRKQLDNSEGY